MQSQSESPIDVASLVARAQAREHEAAETLIEHFFPLVSSIVNGRVPRKIPADDIIQEIFIKAFGKIDQYDGRAPFEHWISRIAVNSCINAMRGQRQKMEIRRADLSEQEDAALDHVASTENNLDPHHTGAAQDLLDQLLSRLSPKERIAMEMIELQGYSSEEASQILGVAPGALRTRVSRARQKLKMMLQKLSNEPNS